MKVPPIHPRSIHRRAALTLLEMMVAVTLLAAIMVGLLAMFNQTQKALQIVNAQSDVFENARGAVQMLTRDLSEMVAFGDSNVVNASSESFFNTALPSLSTSNATWSEAYWLTRVNNEWVPFGYFVSPTDSGVGTLYRFSTNDTPRPLLGADQVKKGVRRERVPALFAMFNAPVQVTDTNVVRRVSEGVVHFDLKAVYLTTNNLGEVLSMTSRQFRFFTNDLPAFVDMEIGVLEPNTLKQFETLQAVDINAARIFLTNHLGNIHFFRERVPVRNFQNLYRSNEVP